MKSRRLRVIIIIGALAMLAYAGWTIVQNSWIDRSLITGSPCSPPCWQGIIPGVTSSTEALEILEKSSYVKPGSIEQVGTNEAGGCIWDWRVSGERVSPGMAWQHHIVKRITLGLNFKLGVGEIIEIFGIPEAIHTGSGGTPEYWYWTITFYYPSQGVEITAFTPEFGNIIEPSTEVVFVLLFSPKSMKERVEELENEISSPLPEDFLMEWKGYGSIDEIYVGNQDDD